MNDNYPKVKIPTDKKEIPLADSNQIVNLVLPYAKKSTEFLLCISVDKEKKPISIRIVAIGSREQATSSIPDILRCLLLDKADGVIFVHNHPGGKANHSNLDHVAMEKMKSASESVFINFIDSIVICEETYQSLSKKQSQMNNTPITPIPTTPISHINHILSAIEDIANLMMPLGLLAISLLVFIIITNNGDYTSMNEIKNIVLIYPIAWSFKTIAGFFKPIFPDQKQ